jgi:hypothetical protein
VVAPAIEITTGDARRRRGGGGSRARQIVAGP